MGKKKHKSKKILIFALILSLIFMSIVKGFQSNNSDYFAKNRSLMLSSPIGLCSGVQIKAPSGKNYILSAAHCMGLANIFFQILVSDESNHKYMRNIVAIDPKSDLMLLEGMPNLEGLPIADEEHNGEHIRTFTHGRGFDTYKSEGIIVGFAFEDFVAITSPIAHGSSGGMAVNDKGELIGTVVAMDDEFYYMSKLSNIHTFLSIY